MISGTISMTNNSEFFFLGLVLPVKQSKLSEWKIVIWESDTGIIGERERDVIM